MTEEALTRLAFGLIEGTHPLPEEVVTCITEFIELTNTLKQQIEGDTIVIKRLSHLLHQTTKTKT